MIELPSTPSSGSNSWTSSCSPQFKSESSPFENYDRHPVQKENQSRNICPTTCVICYAPASGYHYEVPSCNGCKTFFRRNFLSKQAFTCKLEGRCFETWPTAKRTMCRACRYKRCIEVGMNASAILRTTAMQDARKRNNTLSSEDALSPPSLVPVRVIPIEEQINGIIEQLTYLEVKCDRFRKCCFNPDPLTAPRLDQLVEENCKLDLGEKLEPMPDWPLPQGKERPVWSMNRELSFSRRKHWLHFDLLGSIEYAKAFPFFHQLTNQDKVILMKAVSLMCTNITQIFFSYSNKSDKILHPDGTGVNRLKPTLNPGQREEQFVAAKIEAIASMIRSRITTNEYVFAKAIMLCNSSVPDLSSAAVEILNKEKLRLSKMLCMYSMAEFGVHGPSRYAAIMSMISCLEHMVKVQKDYHCLVQLFDPPKNPVKLVNEILG